MNALTLICQTIITLAELVFIAILFIALTRCFYYGMLLLIIIIYKKIIKKIL